MLKLSDAELVVLSQASQRTDGAADLPEGMKPGAARRIAARLVKLGLVRETATKRGMPEWQRDDEGRAISLVILRAGREAIGVDVEATESTPEQTSSGTRRTAEPELNINRPSTRRRRDSDFAAATRIAKSSVTAAKPHSFNTAPRAGTKQALVMGMLSAPGGASLDALANATGWLPHTTRAALTGLRRRGYTIERRRDASGASVYRIGPAGSSPAAAA